MKMIRITVQDDKITELVVVPYDELYFDESRVSSYSWITAGKTRGNIEYVCDHYAENIVDILFKTEQVTMALLGAMDVYWKVMNADLDDEEFHSIKNI